MNKLLTYVMSVLIISVAAFIVYWFLIEDPYVKAMEEIQDKIKREESKYQQHMRDKDDIAKIEKEIEELKVEIFKQLCKARGRTLEEFLKEVEDDSDASLVKLESIRIESVVNKELNSRIPIDFNISGAYFIIYNFLARVQERGKMDFGQGQLTIAQESKMERIPIDKFKKLVDEKSKLYDANKSQFPRLRVTVNGEIIIIDENQLDKYKTKTLSTCPDEGASS